jgi:hypothetical protein
MLSDPFRYAILYIRSSPNVRRLKPILSEVLSPEQFWFLSDRNTLDAIGIAQKSLHDIKMKKLAAMVIKLDLSKAFDKVNLLCLMLILIHTEFCLSFC